MVENTDLHSHKPPIGDIVVPFEEDRVRLSSMSTELSEGSDYDSTDRRRAVKARFESDVFEEINKIRKDRGVEWSTVVLIGIAEIEQDMCPYYNKYGTGDEE